MLAQEFGADIPPSRQFRKTFEEGKKKKKVTNSPLFSKLLGNYEAEKNKGNLISREVADLIPVLVYLCMSTAILCSYLP